MDLNSESATYYKAKHVTCLKYRKRQDIALYPTFCGVEQCIPGFTVGPKVRKNYHLHVILSGKGTLCVGERVYHLQSNQTFLLKPREVVFYQADAEDPWRYCWVSFNGPSAQTYMDAAGFPEGVNAHDCYVDASEFLMLTWKLLECREDTLQNELRRLSLTAAFIALMIESDARSAQPRRHDDSPDVYVDHALDVIRCQYASVKISDIAKHIGINRSYLTNIFKKRTGLSPQEYLLRYRLNMARQLLLTTSQPIQEVARQIGYENPMTFSKMFKSAYGLSPSGYRAQAAVPDAAPSFAAAESVRQDAGPAFGNSGNDSAAMLSAFGNNGNADAVPVFGNNRGDSATDNQAVPQHTADTGREEIP